MLLPDNINPRNSVYYNGAIVLQIVQAYKKVSIIDLYALAKEKENMSFSMLILCLDWLYLIDAVIITDKAEVSLCL